MVIRRIMLLKCRLFVRHVRQEPLWYATLTIPALSAAVVGPSVIGPIRELIQLLADSQEDADDVKSMVRVLSLSVLIGWLFLGVFAGLSSPSIKHLSFLKVLPIRLWRLQAFDLTAAMMRPSFVLIATVVEWFFLTLYSHLELASSLVVFLAVLLFILATHSIVYCVNLTIDLVGGTSIRRKLRVGVLLALVAVTAIVASRGVGQFSVPLLPSVLTYLLPSSMLVDILDSSKNGGYRQLVSLVGLSVYVLVSWGAGRYLLRVLLTGGIGSGRVRKSRRSTLFSISQPRSKSMRVVLLFALRELVYLVRQGRYQLVTLVGVVWVLAIPMSSVLTQNRFTPPHLLSYVMCALLLQTPLYNVFGMESKGVVLNFLLPAHRRDILLGKIVARYLHYIFVMAPGVSWTLFLCADYIHWGIRLSLVLALILITAVNATVGTVGSILFPLRLPLGSLVGRIASAKSDFLSVAAMGSLALLIGLDIYLFYYRSSQPEMMAGVLAALCLLMLLIYVPALLATAALWGRRRDAFLRCFKTWTDL